MAATVLLLRDGALGLEVLMTRRSSSASFAPGAYVFPGGGIDAADAQAHGLATRRPTQTTRPSRISSAPSVIVPHGSPGTSTFVVSSPMFVMSRSVTACPASGS